MITSSSVARADDEQSQCRRDGEHNPRDEQGGVSEQRQEGVPQPVGEHQVIVRQTVAHLPEHDEEVLSTW
jgi:hypothetical protein